MAEEPEAAERAGGGTDPVEQLRAVLLDWRARIDELLVQLDVGSLDLRERTSAGLEAAVNAALAAKPGLSAASRHAVNGLREAEQTVEDVLGDLRTAVTAARDAAGRAVGRG